MAQTYKGNNPEQAIDSVERFQRDLEYLKEQAEPWLERLTRELKLSEEDVYQLAVVFFGRHFDLTRSPDKVVLVIKGDVTPYDSALEALVTDERDENVVSVLLSTLDE